jgi:hypothetical protein
MRAMSARTIVCSAWPWWLVANRHRDQRSRLESLSGFGKVVNEAASSTNTVVRNMALPGQRSWAPRNSASKTASSPRVRSTNARCSGVSERRERR